MSQEQNSQHAKKVQRACASLSARTKCQKCKSEAQLSFMAVWPKRCREIHFFRSAWAPQTQLQIAALHAACCKDFAIVLCCAFSNQMWCNMLGHTAQRWPSHQNSSNSRFQSIVDGIVAVLISKPSNREDTISTSLLKHAADHEKINLLFQNTFSCLSNARQHHVMNWWNRAMSQTKFSEMSLLDSISCTPWAWTHKRTCPRDPKRTGGTTCHHAPHPVPRALHVHSESNIQTTTGYASNLGVLCHNAA